MKIQELKCEQFAGIQDCNINFEDGLNLIVGPNESGKSTVVDLLYHIFFQDTALNARIDKEFKEKYFPKSIGSYQADTIDGTVKFYTENGTYKLSKEWPGKTTSKLTLPDGVIIRDNTTISEILANVLQYGKGVYDELIFSSQKREQTILTGLLGGKSIATEELSSTITKAVMETGGVDTEKMERIINDNVASYNGRWDFDSNLPEGGVKRGIKNPWKVGIGKILEAYYAKEELAVKQNNVELAEKAVMETNQQIIRYKGELTKLNDTRERFAKAHNALSERNNLNKLLNIEESKLNEANAAYSDWPNCIKKLEKAELLKQQLEQANAKKLYHDVKIIKELVDKNIEALGRTKAVDEKDIQTVENLQNSILRLEAKLSGMNLMANIIPLGSDQIQITSVSTGEILEWKDGAVSIQEAVRIHIPNVVDIQLMPKDINLAEIQEQLDNAKKGIKDILDQYSVDSIQQLKKINETRVTLETENERNNLRMKTLLGNQSWENLEAITCNISDDIPPINEIEQQIEALGGVSIERYIGSMINAIEKYKSSYGSIGKLQEQIARFEVEISKYHLALTRITEIPEEFTAISDPEAYDTQLKGEIEILENDLELLRRRLSEAEKNLGDESAEELQEQLNEREQYFEQQKADYNRWLRIQKEFYALKDAMYENPLTDVETNFKAYLAQLTDESITLREMNDSLICNIVSGNHPLNASILSEGTKDTILLAFRLAVLEHLYPEGNAIAVFDDPFTDMDAKRTAEACKLIQKFAANNQVIFVTCDEKYKTLLNGNIIALSNAMGF